MGRYIYEIFLQGGRMYQLEGDSVLDVAQKIPEKDIDMVVSIELLTINEP